MHEDRELTQTEQTAETKPERKRKTKRKKQKTVYVDDGHTVYDMSGLTGEKKGKGDISLTRKERFAMIRAAFAHYLPIFLLVLGCFVLTGLILYIWLMH